MARQVLENGVILPAEYSDDWYDDMTSNLTKLDDVIGSDSEKLSSADVGAAALSNNYNDLDNLPTIPTVNDGTLTIQKNGVDVQTFTANASSNVTANITVPTKTSDLTNDSGFITSDDTKIPLAGSNAISGDLIPSTDGTVNLGSPSYQWNNLYATNYYYNGTAWGLDQVNEWSENNKFNKKADLANITSVEDTTFAFTALNNTIFFNTRGSSNFKSYGTFLLAGYGNGSGPDRYGQIQLLRSTDKNGDTGNGYIPDSSFKMWRVAPHYLVMDFMENVRVTNDGTENSLKPITNNATDLGTSTNKWKSFNGVEPSSLGMPDLSNGIDISSYITIGDTDNNYTPPANGWICIRSANATKISVLDSVTNIGNGTTSNTATYLTVMTPVVANRKVIIRAVCTTLSSAYFIPCQGNV